MKVLNSLSARLTLFELVKVKSVAGFDSGCEEELAHYD